MDVNAGRWMRDGLDQAETELCLCRQGPKTGRSLCHVTRYERIQQCRRAVLLRVTVWAEKLHNRSRRDDKRTAR